MSTQLPVIVVNQADEPIGSAQLHDAWANDQTLRIVRVMIEDGNGSIILQKRSPDKEHFPNCWDNSAAGYVDAGESYETAAYRELAEEIGLTNIKLQQVGKYSTSKPDDPETILRFITIYKGTTATDAPLKLQASEVSEARWFRLEEVRKLLADSSDKVSDGLVEVFERYY